MGGLVDVSGVVLLLVDEGRPVEYVTARSGRRTVKIDRRWEVQRDGRRIGEVRYEMRTRETRSKGRMYVNSRWWSPGWVGRSTCTRHMPEWPSKAAVVRWLVAMDDSSGDRPGGGGR